MTRGRNPAEEDFSRTKLLRTKLDDQMTPSELAKEVGSGLLSFPVTHFHEDLSFDEAGYRAHIGWLRDHKVAGLFAAGGTGEFFSLSPNEVERVVRAAVEETGGKVPVIAGVGYGTAIACDLAKAAERTGADAILLLPTYLIDSEPGGLAAHIETVCKATKLGVIFYNRDNARLDEAALAQVCERCPNLVGFKDEIGDIERMTRICATMGDRLTYMAGFQQRRPSRSLFRDGRHHLFLGNIQFPS